MHHPTLEKVKELSKQGNLVSIWKELPADLETPISVYLKLRGDYPSFLLESVEKGEIMGRYSFLGIDPSAILTARDGQATLQAGNDIKTLNSAGGDPMDAARSIMSQYKPVRVDGLPRFCGGLVGYLAYDAVRFFERSLMPDNPGLDMPDAVFMLADTLVAFDHVKHRVLVMSNVKIDEDVESSYRTAANKIDEIISRLTRPLPENEPSQQVDSVREDWSSNVEQADFEAGVRRAKEYIAAGDAFQIVLSQRLSRKTSASPFAIYRALRMVNPSPYMFFIELPDDLHLIGSSPELLVRLDGYQAQVRPIAGTRPRGDSPEKDEELARELLADPKELAEHVMLVDLGRNDLGRVCRYGSVHTPERMVVERYSHVMHIVSSVKGELRKEYDSFDLLQAAFPAGTVSGAPKVRAMEIIAELENERRGVYAGGVGYFSYSGDMDTCIAIRTLVMQGDRVHVQAGAGIVADSDPNKEYHETLNKARALAEAVRIAEKNGS
ncbi:MAG: anthranilate synthase component I [Anaerolineales bacterium]|nr:anthranilate synthase component I [Anaerolineales bacterium]